MPNNIEFNVLVSGLDGFNNQLKGAQTALDSFTSYTKSLSRELSSLGSIFTLTGAALAGPITLAYKDMSKNSVDIAQQTQRLSDMFEQFQREIGGAVVPVFTAYNNVLENLLGKFNSINPIVRDQIIQATLLAGTFLIVAGVFAIISSRVVKLISDIAGLASKLLSVNPIVLATVLAFAALIYLMLRFKAAGDTVISFFQSLFLIGQIVIQTISLAFEKLFLVVITGAENAVNALSKIWGPQQQALKDLAAQIDKTRIGLQGMANVDAAGLQARWVQLTGIIKTGTGSWSDELDAFKKNMKDFLNSLGSGSGSGGLPPQINNFINGFKDGLDQIGVKVNDLHTAGVNFTNTLQTGMSTAFSNIILGTESVSAAFAEFGASILKAIVDFITQWIAFQIISKVATGAATALGITTAATLAQAYAPAAALASLASFGANSAPASAGIASTVTLANILAIPKFSTGTSGIADDTLGLFNKDEIIIPKTFSDGLKSGQLSLSGNGRGSGGSKQIIFDFTGAKFNGITDKLVKDIFTKASENINNKTLTFRSQ